MNEEQRRLEYERKRLQILKRESKIWEREGGLPIDNPDFNFILSHGGKIIEENIPYVDNYYIHRAKISTKKGIEYKFKTLTEEKYHFEPAV